MANNGDSHGYDGDEEPTPAERTRISAEARAFAELALQYSHASSQLWNCARLLDAAAGSDRVALLSKLVVELTGLVASATQAQKAVEIKLAEAMK